MRVSAITLSVAMYCTYKMIVHIQHSIYTNSDLTVSLWFEVFAFYSIFDSFMGNL